MTVVITTYYGQQHWQRALHALCSLYIEFLFKLKTELECYGIKHGYWGITDWTFA